MTYQQIEKEFDEELPKMISDLVWCVSDGGYKIESHRFLSYQDEPVQEYENIKSFLKQSFIKYLKDEVEETKAMIAHTPDEVAKLNQHLPSTLQRATYSEAVGYCKAISDQITHITNQIKELEV